MTDKDHPQQTERKELNLRQLAEQLLYKPGGTDRLSEAFGGTLEGFGKLLVALTAVAYAVGVFITGLYHASLSIRHIEWLQLQYVFIGFAYMIFAYLALVFPLKHISRRGWRITYFFVLGVVCFVNSELTYYIWFLVGNPSFVMPHDYGFQIVFYFVVALITLAFAVGVFWLSKKFQDDLKNFSLLPVGFSLCILMYTFSVSMFPRIPQSLGGGALPTAHVVFAEDAPLEMTVLFDIIRDKPEPVGFSHYARVLHADGDSIVFVPAPWFSTDAIEVDRSMVVAMEFKGFNPAEARQSRQDEKSGPE